ncbi:MAG: hypothetical protein AWU59_2363 [Methanolobus sp. T82-4]|nr:MAG: hypothetical protein AWU59_2363 [Methanolobus sp. T82-4]
MNNTTIKTTSMLLAILIFSVAFISSVNAGVNAVNNDSEIVKDYQVNLTPEPEPIVVLSSTTQKDPYWYLLEADKQEQKILFDYIDNCYVTSVEKEEMKKAIKDIWKRYPSQLTEDDYEILGKIEKSTAEYLNDKYGYDEIGVKWSGDDHEDMIYRAVRKWGIDTTYANIAKNAAAEPDSWDSGFWQSYNHYYDPSIGFGYAAMNCEDFIDDAATYYDNAQLTNAYTNLGYSSHYMSDLGNPMHTGHSNEQYSNQWVHTSYEAYVNNNWNSGYEYSNIIDDTTTYYVITDPEQAAENLATYSHARLDDLYDEVYYHPTTFGSDSDVITITDEVLHQTAKYNLGLVKYIRS